MQFRIAEIRTTLVSFKLFQLPSTSLRSRTFEVLPKNMAAGIIRREQSKILANPK